MKRHPVNGSRIPGLAVLICFIASGVSAGEVPRIRVTPGDVLKPTVVEGRSPLTTHRVTDRDAAATVKALVAVGKLPSRCGLEEAVDAAAVYGVALRRDASGEPTDLTIYATLGPCHLSEVADPFVVEATRLTDGDWFLTRHGLRMIGP